MIDAVVIDTFKDGSRRLMRADKPGTVGVIGKDGTTVPVSYPAGAAILSGVGGVALVGPVSFQSLCDLAERVLDGDPRALTDPLSLLALASGICTFRSDIRDAIEDDGIGEES